MAKGKGPIDFSNPSEILGGGGTFFNDGVYRVERACFTDYDFNGTVKPAVLCFCMELQPLDAKGKDSGDAVVRYWSLMATNKEGDATMEGITPIKGRKGEFAQIQFTDASEYDTIWKLSDYGIFLENAQKNEIDMDAIGNDVTNFEGNVYEFGKVLKTPKPKTVVEEAEDGEKGKEEAKRPQEVVVLVGMGGKGKSASAKGKTKQEPDDDDKPTKKSTGRSKQKEDDSPEGIVKEWIRENVLTDDNEGGTAHIDHRVDLSRYLKRDKEMDPADVKEGMAFFNDEDELGAFLTTEGWELTSKGLIKKSK